MLHRPAVEIERRRQGAYIRGWQIPSQGYRGMDDPLGSDPMNKLGVVLAEIGERVEVLVS